MTNNTEEVDHKLLMMRYAVLNFYGRCAAPLLLGYDLASTMTSMKPLENSMEDSTAFEYCFVHMRWSHLSLQDFLIFHFLPLLAYLSNMIRVLRYLFKICLALHDRINVCLSALCIINEFSTFCVFLLVLFFLRCSQAVQRLDIS